VLGVQSGHPLPGAELAQHPQVGAENLAVPVDGVEARELDRRVAAHAVAEPLEHPVLVEGVALVGVRVGQQRLHRQCLRDLPVGLGREREQLLAVLAGLVRQGRARVVEGEGVVAVVEVRPGRREVGGQVLARQPAQLAAGNELVVIVRLVAVEEGVLHVAVVLRLAHGDPALQALRQRSARGRLEVPAIVVAVAGLDAALDLGPGVSRLYVHHAGERAGAEARALRPAQHLHLLDVHQRRGAGDADELDAVHGHADRGEVLGIDELLELADAADLHEAGPAAGGGEVHIGHGVQRVLQVDPAALADPRGLDDGHAADALEKLGLAKTGGDHDLLERLGGSARGGKRRQEQAGTEVQQGFLEHVRPLNECVKKTRMGFEMRMSRLAMVLSLRRHYPDQVEGFVRAGHLRPEGHPLGNTAAVREAPQWLPLYTRPQASQGPPPVPGGVAAGSGTSTSDP